MSRHILVSSFREFLFPLSSHRSVGVELQGLVVVTWTRRLLERFLPLIQQS
jgi:hypothetical protein